MIDILILSHSDPNIVFLVVQGVCVSWFNDAMVSMERSPRDAIKDELVRPPFIQSEGCDSKRSIGLQDKIQVIQVQDQERDEMLQTQHRAVCKKTENHKTKVLYKTLP